MDPLLIQRPPLGLLDLLGLKGTGQAPVQLQETVSATLADCVDYYLLNRRELVSASTGVAMVANTYYAVQVIPEGEVWFVYNFGVRLNAATAAATSIRFWGTYAMQASSALPMPLTETVSVGASDNGGTAVQFPRPLLFAPGVTFGINSGAVTGVPNAPGRIYLDCARLRL